MWLATDVWVQRDRADKRGILRLAQHLIELIHDEVREMLRGHTAHHDRRRRAYRGARGVGRGGGGVSRSPLWGIHIGVAALVDHEGRAAMSFQVHDAADESSPADAALHGRRRHGPRGG